LTSVRLEKAQDKNIKLKLQNILFTKKDIKRIHLMLHNTILFTLEGFVPGCIRGGD